MSKLRTHFHSLNIELLSSSSFIAAKINQTEFISRGKCHNRSLMTYFLILKKNTQLIHILYIKSKPVIH